MVKFIYGVCRFWFIFFVDGDSRTDVRWIGLLVRASPLGLQRFVCRSWAAIVFIVSHFVPDYVILNFHVGRRREGDATWLLSLNILRASWPSVAILPSHNNSNANTKDSTVRRRFLRSAHLVLRFETREWFTLVFHIFIKPGWKIDKGLYITCTFNVWRAILYVYIYRRNKNIR